MISVQSAMLVALGFLIAGLLGLLIGSALWSRAVRLTTRRIKQSMPVSESEIRADRDRLRADFAIRVHKLETALEQAKLERARQFIEVNRRDASVSTLETLVGDLKAELEEHVNARRVLEQTVSDRLPRIEARLAEAKRLLFNRDREIAELTAGSRRHKLALDEASSLTQQQNAQIEKLSSALSVKTRKDAKDVRFEGELLLRTEVETLRAKAQEQQTLIERLQQRLGQNGAQDASPRAHAEAAQKTQEIERLQKKLAEAEDALAAVRASTSEVDTARIAFESEIRGLKTKAEDQAAEIARLTAAVQTYDRIEADNGAVKESKMVLKARLGSAQAHSDQQAATIGRLRAELAATHERLARQAAHFMDEMRRITQAQISEGGQAGRRRPLRIADESLAERVGHVRPLLPEPRDRNGQVQELASQIKRAQAVVGMANTAAAGGAETTETEGGEEGRTAPIAARADGEIDTLVNAESNGSPSVSVEAAAELPQAPLILEERRRPRLLDRLSGLAKG